MHYSTILGELQVQAYLQKEFGDVAVRSVYFLKGQQIAQNPPTSPSDPRPF